MALPAYLIPCRIRKRQNWENAINLLIILLWLSAIGLAISLCVHAHYHTEYNHL